MSDKSAELAAEYGLADADMLSVYSKIGEALRGAFGACDSGVGQGWCDFWVQHQGVEYKLVMKPHRATGTTQ